MNMGIYLLKLTDTAAVNLADASTVTLDNLGLPVAYYPNATLTLG